MSWVIRSLEGNEDLHRVRSIYALCHPNWPERSASWYFANPTLVASSSGQPESAGYTSFAVDPTTNVMYGRDVCVRPVYQGGGLARRLVEARESIGRELGVKIFVGCTWEENVAMRRIFDNLGYHTCQRVPGHFPHNDPPADGIIYIKANG